LPSAGIKAFIIARLSGLVEQRWLHYLLLAGAMTLLACACHWKHWRWADTLDNLVLDAGYRLRALHTPADVAESLPATCDIVMIELPHPVSKHLLAALVTQCARAKAVALDVMLVDQSTELSDEEKNLRKEDLRTWQRETAELAGAMRKSGNVVIGAWSDESWITPVSREEIWQRPPLTCWQQARYRAHLTVIPDTLDHIVRRVPLFFDVQGDKHSAPERLPCLGLALAAAAEGISAKDLSHLLNTLPAHDGSFVLGDHRIDFDQQGQMLINFVGDRTCFEYGTNSMVYHRALQLYRPETFAGKLVFIGGSDIKSKDFFPTPYGLMSDVQIHANIAATLRDGAPRMLSSWVLFALGFCCVLVLIVPLMRWPLWSTICMALADLLLVIGFTIWLFGYAHLVLAASVPLLAVVLSYNVIVIYEYSRVHLTLAKFVGPDMVKRALYRFAHFRLGAGNVELASAMFCDLRGFSTLAESLPPETMAGMLNDYTGTVVSVVKQFHGRPVDFVGDGIFVLFEESLAGRQYPLQAARAALAVLQEFAACRERWIAGGLPPLEIGMAIDTGPMMIGLLGSEHFLKMGAVGDVVNVAARVQGLSTTCGYDILVTQATCEWIQAEIAAEYCGDYPVRGRTQPVAIYGLAAARRPVGAKQL